MTEIFKDGRRIKVRNIARKLNRTFDKYGKPYDQMYVEFTVIGKSHEYQHFMLLDDFQSCNPHIPIAQA